jgi:hypothetical protein
LRNVQVRYTIQGNSQLSMQPLRWPDFCACCGRPNPPTRASLQHTARQTSSTVDTGVSRTTTSSGYPLRWDVSVCETCLAHQKRTLNPLSPALLVGAWLAIAFAVGYALFAAGVSEDAVAIGGFVAFLALTALGGYGIYRRVGVNRVAQATALMTPKCTNAGPAVAASSNLEVIAFSFPNDPYAESFAGINGL